jgi:hypothetical protein
VGAHDLREAGLQGFHDVLSIVHGKRRLRHEGESRLVGDRDPRDVVERLDERDGSVRELPHRADYLRVAGVANEHDVTAALAMDLRLAVNLGDQRAGGVDREETACGGARGHGFGHPVGGKDHRRAGVRDLVKLAHENRALSPEALDHVLVVNDLVTHINRRTMHRERPLDSVDRPHHAGAEAARRAEQDPEGGLVHDGSDLAR